MLGAARSDGRAFLARIRAIRGFAVRRSDEASERFQVCEQSAPR